MLDVDDSAVKFDLRGVGDAGQDIHSLWYGLLHLTYDSVSFTWRSTLSNSFGTIRRIRDAKDLNTSITSLSDIVLCWWGHTRCVTYI